MADDLSKLGRDAATAVGNAAAGAKDLAGSTVQAGEAKAVGFFTRPVPMWIVFAAGAGGLMVGWAVL